jgi:hypothetical protein
MSDELLNCKVFVSYESWPERNAISTFALRNRGMPLGCSVRTVDDFSEIRNEYFQNTSPEPNVQTSLVGKTVSVESVKQTLLPGNSEWALRCDRLCGLVARVPGYRSRGPGYIPDTTRCSEK